MNEGRSVKETNTESFDVVDPKPYLRSLNRMKRFSLFSSFTKSSVQTFAPINIRLFLC